jgi:hypothetical protein
MLGILSFLQVYLRKRFSSRPCFASSGTKFCFTRDLLSAELSERHLLGVDLELDEGLLHLLDVEDERDQLLDRLGQIRAEKQTRGSEIEIGTKK